MNRSVAQDIGYDELFKAAGKKYSLDWKLLKAIAVIESSLGTHPTVKRGIENPYDVEGSKSTDGKSWGLMQVTIPTARDYDAQASAVKLNNIKYSIDIASKHLQYLFSFFKARGFSNSPRLIEFVIKSYNQGQGNMLKEISGSMGYADTYWRKYQDAYKSIPSV